MPWHQWSVIHSAQYLVTAFENRPSLPFVAGDLGFLYLESGDGKLAKKFLQLAHRQQPSDKNILRLLAEAEFLTQNFEVAVDLFERAVILDPTRQRARQLLAWLLATCPFEGKRDGQRTIEMMQPWVNSDSKSPIALEIYAAGLAETGRFEEAVQFQQQAADLIENKTSEDPYFDSQQTGLLSRLELYRRKRPYRTAAVDRNPIAPPNGDSKPQDSDSDSNLFDPQ